MKHPPVSVTFLLIYQSTTTKRNIFRLNSNGNRDTCSHIFHRRASYLICTTNTWQGCHSDNIKWRIQQQFAIKWRQQCEIKKNGNGRQRIAYRFSRDKFTFTHSISVSVSTILLLFIDIYLPGIGIGRIDANILGSHTHSCRALLCSLVSYVCVYTRAAEYVRCHRSNLFISVQWVDDIDVGIACRHLCTWKWIAM